MYGKVGFEDRQLVSVCWKRTQIYELCFLDTRISYSEKKIAFCVWLFI